MRRTFTIVLLIIACAALMLAQNGPAAGNVPATSFTGLGTDVLGAHLVYGRGCVACHAPHSGPAGNGVAGTGANVALWGQDLTNLFGKTLGFGDIGGTSVTLPANSAAVTSAHDATTIIMLCLSCHDGNVAKSGMMQGTTVETLPVAGGKAPSFLGNDGSGAGNYANDHPVGINAAFGCNPTATPTVGYNWDCTINSNGSVSMTGAASSVFANSNYGFAVSLSTYTNNGTSTPIVTCTSCHDQHSNYIYSGKINGTQGYYATMFFLRGYYQPGTGGNSAAQFCRQCHGGESNEMHGQMSIKTN